MISKNTPQSSFKKALDYLMNRPERYEVAWTVGVDNKDKLQMIRDFERQAALYPRVGKPCFKMIVAFHPDDTEKIRGKELLILKEWLKEFAKERETLKCIHPGIDLSDTQIAIIRHHDTAHPHFHIVANMVQNNGKRLNVSKCGIKGKYASKTITKRYQLTTANLLERRKNIQATNESIVATFSDKRGQIATTDDQLKLSASILNDNEYKLKGNERDEQRQNKIPPEENKKAAGRRL